MDEAVINDEGHKERRFEPVASLDEDELHIIHGAIGQFIEVAGEVALLGIHGIDAVLLNMFVDAMTPTRTGAFPGPFTLVGLLLDWWCCLLLYLWLLRNKSAQVDARLLGRRRSYI